MSSLVLFHTRRVREALKSPGAIGVDLLLLGAMAAVIGTLMMVGKQVAAPYHETVEISLSYWALPKYTLFSLSRGLAAYVLSLVFTLIYGTVAAHNHRAEKIMIPALDVLQALPVLSFLPIILIAMIRLFPTRNIGLELACVITIFTAQVWNMTFSFHGSLRAIPAPFREVAKIQRLSGWQTFKLLEVPAAMIGLVWNSMMSMAGGWFFLMVNEAFNLAGKDYRLPGIGSYMNEAVNQGNTGAMIWAIVAMIIMIVTVDQILWRPIVVWSERFKMEDSSGGDKPQSWVLSLLQYSGFAKWISRRFAARRRAREMGMTAALAANPVPLSVASGEHFLPARMTQATLRGEGDVQIAVILKWIVAAGISLLAMWGVWSLVKLLAELPLHDTVNHQDWIHVVLALLASFLRTTSAVVLGLAWTLPVGILIGLSPKWSQRLQPLIQVAASFPAPMLFPLVTLALVAMHIPFTAGCVALMLLGAQWYILFNVIAGASAIPADLKEVANTYGMSTWQKWSRLYLPSVFPYLVTGLVTAAGGAWNATIVSEYVPVKGNVYQAFGLGAIISMATASGNFSLLAAGVVVMAVFVVLINRVFWKKMYRLAEDRYSLNT